MFRLPTPTISRRLTGVALAAALAFSAASFALPAATSAHGTQACPPLGRAGQGSLDAQNVNAALDAINVNAALDAINVNARLELSGIDARFELSGVDFTTATENLGRNSDCGGQK